jgi:hypothetical protein
MTPEKATALRRPFPPESVGQLPKGGAMLDFVGHAAVTDRLLAVDPEWSWEPLALGPDGLPALDAGRNLWIRLTICGVTRIGVGDGKSAKECIGDAIRNAAMRFGVALDLWAKEDLVEFAQAAATSHQAPPDPWATDPSPAPDVPASEPPADAAAGPVTPPRTKRERAGEDSPLLDTKSKLAVAMYAQLRKNGIDKAGATQLYRDITAREVTSSKELTEAEARLVLKELDPPKGGGAS